MVSIGFSNGFAEDVSEREREHGSGNDRKGNCSPSLAEHILCYKDGNKVVKRIFKFRIFHLDTLPIWQLSEFLSWVKVWFDYHKIIYDAVTCLR